MKLRPQVGLVGNTSQVIQAMAGGSYDLAIAGEWVQAGCMMMVCHSKL